MFIFIFFSIKISLLSLEAAEHLAIRNPVRKLGNGDVVKRGERSRPDDIEITWSRIYGNCEEAFYRVVIIRRQESVVISFRP